MKKLVAIALLLLLGGCTTVQLPTSNPHVRLVLPTFKGFPIRE